jgi:hypothetical protein
MQSEELSTGCIREQRPVLLGTLPIAAPLPAWTNENGTWKNSPLTTYSST